MSKKGITAVIRFLSLRQNEAESSSLRSHRKSMLNADQIST